LWRQRHKEHVPSAKIRSLRPANSHPHENCGLDAGRSLDK
jgi:hypothetical protein